jgi:hypothetical protein
MPGVFNIAKGRGAHYGTLPAANDAIIVVLLKDAVTSPPADLVDFDTLAAILAVEDEANFTNYVRPSLANVVVNVDDTANGADVNADDYTYVNAGGATNNDIVVALFCYDPDTTGGTDSSIIPITWQEWVWTTTGASQLLELHPRGFYGAR